MTRFAGAFAGPGTSVIYVDENGAHVLYSDGSRTFDSSYCGLWRTPFSPYERRFPTSFQ
jgi:hypothetical protein